ncbi:hypothetical protein PCA10_08640 [Metapseudomonas resinovorans NBRC 106553]|uniref:Spore coat protein U/FanG domain-containing protein n=2 Tax=Metapseudomonas resinovorans TaxID=53412 RepID=S6ARH0_METRE|nr:hypothetical protein PCA10_08640 [Pseudomonas resinovorans NBRC 106553]
MVLMTAPACGFAATKSATIGFSAEVLPACSIGGTAPGNQGQFGTLDFGSHFSLSSVINLASTVGNGSLRVNCLTGTPYRVLMSGGGSNNVNARRMTGPGSAQVAYNLYTSSSYLSVWDNSVGVTGVGNGSDQHLAVYGRVPAQATPAPGVYSDTVVVTVSW